jgi:hypothetical protein
VLVEVEESNGKDSERDGDERSGNDGCPLLQNDDENERGEADEQGQAAGSAELRQEFPELLEEIALALLHTEKLGQLPDDDGQREPDDEPLQDRLGDEAREEAEAKQARDDREDPGHQPERHGQRDELVRPCVARSPTAAADNAAVAAIGPVTRCLELPNAA